MNSTMFFTICSLFYSLLLIFLISSKKKNYKNNSERKLYNILVISNFIGIIIELLCVVTCRNYKKIPFTNSALLIYQTGIPFASSISTISLKICIKIIFNVFINLDNYFYKVYIYYFTKRKTQF